MNALQNDPKRGTSDPKDSPVTVSAIDFMKMAKPIGSFAGSTDFILRFRDGEPVAADVGDEGRGQN